MSVQSLCRVTSRIRGAGCRGSPRLSCLWVVALVGVLGCPADTEEVLAECVPLDVEDGSALEGPRDPVEAATAFVRDPLVRRAALEASVRVADTEYGRLRLHHYSLRGACLDAPARDWDSRPVYLPNAVRPLRVGEEATDRPSPAPSGPVGELDGLETLSDWIELGRQAFHRYPISVDASFRVLRARERAEAFGVRVDLDGMAETLVESQVADGSWAVGITCATCHARPMNDGSLLNGPANPGLHYGVITGDAWPLGTVDVTPDEVDNPVRPSDLRAYALQERIHHAGNLANGRIARMVRIETLIASQLSYAARPDRRIVAALTLYLESLASELPEPDSSSAGAALFAAECGSCHQGVGMAGPPVAAEQVGTNPDATVGSTRATGGYRSPSLRGVAQRALVMHDASANGLLGVLQLQESPHTGHRYGLDLTIDERWDLAVYLGVERERSD